jgi:hypothetical protein
MCRDPWETAVEEVVEGIKRVEVVRPYTPIYLSWNKRADG